MSIERILNCIMTDSVNARDVLCIGGNAHIRNLLLHLSNVNQNYIIKKLKGKKITWRKQLIEKVYL